MSDIQHPISNIRAENQISPSSSNIKNYIFTSLVLLLGVAVIYLFLQNQQIKNSINNQVNSVPGVEQNMSDEIQQNPSATNSNETSVSNNWVSTGISGGGVSFKYPLGWHVASATSDDYSSEEVYISDEPIMTKTTHGPYSLLFLDRRNGLENPEEAYKDMVGDDIAMLENVKQEKLTSKYFSEILHISGNYKGGGFGPSEFEKYYFFNTDPKFGDLSDSINRPIITVTVNPTYGLNGISAERRELIGQLVVSVKECRLGSCEKE